MQVIKQTYQGLLADVSQLSGLSEIRGMEYDVHWGLDRAPQLEKYVLATLETGASLPLEEFPRELQRLAVRSVVDPKCLRFLRQLLLFANKALVQHDNTKTAKAYQTFFETNNEVQRFGEGLGRSSPPLLDLVRKHVQSVLYRFDEKGIVPFHGPGASLSPKTGPWKRWYRSIEYCYPYSDYFSLYQNREQLEQFTDPTDDAIDCELVAVPKDSRGPRLICIHPAEAIWIQQGLRVGLERAIEAPRSADGAWPCGHVHFDDQSVNGRLSLESSCHRGYATLDMKEASDRLSEPLIQILFGRKYKWFGCCRAQSVSVRDPLFKQVSDLHCYAPMGNATTFPVQSLVFWAICCASMHYHGFHQPNNVFVFGDDIIVPTEAAEFVVDDLESFGLRVNRLKSFWRGHFRESCGVDAYKGFDVTPVRWRAKLDTDSMSDLVSLSDLAMRLRLAGYEEASVALYSHVRRISKDSYGHELFLTNNPNHGGLAEFSRLDASVFRDAYWHPTLHWFMSPVVRLQEVEAKCIHLQGWNPVLESVCSLERTGRSNVPNRHVSRREKLTRGWIPVL